MNMRINWKALIVIVLFVSVLFATVFSLRLWRKSLTAKNSLQNGIKAYDEHRWTQAVKEFGRYLAVNPQNVPVLKKYAKSRLNMRPLSRENLQQAIAAYRTILHLEADNSEAAENLINLYLQLQAASEAELIARQYLMTNTNSQIQILLALSLLKQRQYEEACSLLSALMQEDPEEIVVFKMLADISKIRPDLLSVPAEQWHQQAILKNPSSAFAYINRGIFYLENHQLEKALSDLHKAEQLDLASMEAHLRLVNAFVTANQLEKARDHLRQINSKNPDNLVLWQSWAKIAMMTGSLEEMRYVAQNGVESLQPDMWDFLPVAIELFIRCGQYETAQSWIEQLYEKDFDPVIVYKLRALMAWEKDDPYTSIKCWKQVYQAGDESQRTYLALASAYQEIGDSESAILWLRELISKQPHSVQGLLSLSRIYNEKGRWQEAADAAQKAARLTANNEMASLLYIRAEINEMKTRTEKPDQRWFLRFEKELNTLQNSSEDANEIYLVQFDLSLMKEDDAKADQYLQILKKNKPNDERVRLAECQLLVVRGMVASAIDLLKDSVNQTPLNTTAIEYLAYLLVQQDRQSECKALLLDSIPRVTNRVSKRGLILYTTSLLDRWQQQQHAYDLLYDMTTQMPLEIPLKREFLKYVRDRGEMKKMQQIINEMRQIEGEGGWQWRYEQANAWFISDDFLKLYPQIITRLKENLSFNPSDQQSRMLLARTYEKAEDLQLSLATYKEALNYAPEDIHIILPVISIMYKTGEYDTADKLLNQITKKKLYQQEIAHFELKSFLRKGDYASAENAVSQMYARNPGNTQLCLTLALLQIRQGKYEPAEELLNGLRDVEPNSISAAAALSELYVHQQQYDEAMAICNKMVSIHNNAAAYILRGQVCLAAGSTGQALNDFEQAVVLEPQNMQAWLAKSEFYKASGQIDKAVTAMEKAITISPDDIRLQKRLIDMLLVTNSPENIRRAGQILTKAKSAVHSDIELKLYEAKFLLLEKDADSVEKARQILLTVTEEDPKVIHAWILLSELYMQRNLTGRAMDVVLQGLAYLPEDNRLLLMKARIEALRSPAAALPTFELLYKRQPKNTNLMLELARTYTAAQHYDESIKLLQNYMDANSSDNNEIQIQLAAALYKSGQIQQSQDVFESLYQKNSTDSGILMAEIELFIDNHQWEAIEQRLTRCFEEKVLQVSDADAVVTKLLETKDSSALRISERLISMMLTLQPESSELNKSMAILYQIKGAISESAEIYSQILKTNPDDVVALNNLAWLRCEQQHKYEEALQLAQHGLLISPDYVDLIDTRGVIFYRMKQYDKAVEDLSRCTELYPKDSASMGVVYFHLGRVFAAMQNNRQAIDHFKLSLDMNDSFGGLSSSELDEVNRFLKELSLERTQATNDRRRQQI